MPAQSRKSAKSPTSKPRRTYATGSLKERRPGVWTVRLSRGRDRATGERLRDAFTVKGSRREAEQFLRKLLNQQDEGEGGSIREARNIGFGEYAEKALRRNSNATETTRERMVGLFTRYTSPALRNESLANVTRKLLNQERDRLLTQKSQHSRDGKPLSAKTVTLVMAAWATVFRTAMEDQLLPANPMRGIRWPKLQEGDEQKGGALAPEETERVLHAAAGDRWEALWLLMLRLGPRPSEALALRWQDIDFDHGTLTIQRALVRVKGQWTFGPTKTRKKRKIALPLPISAALRKHCERQQEERNAGGADYLDVDLVFADPAGRIAPAWSFKKMWKRLLKRAGVSTTYRLYDTRHSAATRLIEQGLDYTNVAKILGNSPAMVAKRYGHARDEVQRAALERVCAGSDDAGGKPTLAVV